MMRPLSRAMTSQATDCGNGPQHQPRGSARGTCRVSQRHRVTMTEANRKRNIGLIASMLGGLVLLLAVAFVLVIVMMNR